MGKKLENIEIEKEIVRIDQEIDNLRRLLSDYKTLAAGDFKRSEIEDELAELRREKQRLYDYL